MMNDDAHSYMTTSKYIDETTENNDIPKNIIDSTDRTVDEKLRQFFALTTGHQEGYKSGGEVRTSSSVNVELLNKFTDGNECFSQSDVVVIVLFTSLINCSFMLAIIFTICTLYNKSSWNLSYR